MVVLSGISEGDAMFGYDNPDMSFVYVMYKRVLNRFVSKAIARDSFMVIWKLACSVILTSMFL